ncbi:hypothetical protein OBBRIDRAFT_837024 [Obba rivulosa]|uniref:Uncharacterized protein n=1 Tax=Obba rivulosa TaxID=1052685 RepID=A0A8E2DH90_9APHY|nr:hypothetical protein OBBRIDRAFT_837024 [Obba rivulosa]
MDRNPRSGSSHPDDSRFVSPPLYYQPERVRRGSKERAQRNFEERSLAGSIDRGERTSGSLFTRREDKRPRIRIEDEDAVETHRKPAGKVHRDGKKPPVEHLLRPYVLMGRLQSLCDKGELDEARKMLLNAPLDAKRVKHFNLLIKTAGALGKHNEMYDIYIEMKRRGFVPNSSSYYTLFAGYGTIEDWDHRTKQITQVDNAFESYKSYVATISEQDVESPLLSVAPFNIYIKILGATKQYEKLYDVYYAMPQDGPLSPDVKAFTFLFEALVETKKESGSMQQIRPQNISFAKVLWRNILKKLETTPGFKLDSHLIRAALRVFRAGSAIDQTFAFDVICRDTLGLAKPGETAPPPKVELTEFIIRQVIALCNGMQRWRLAVHFAQQIINKPLEDGEDSVVTRNIVDEVLFAYANLGTMGSMNEPTQALSVLEWAIRQNALQRGDALEPQITTFTRVLATCWRSGDWASASRTFDLMSGYHSGDFADLPASTERPAPQMEKRSPGRNILPGTTHMCHLTRAALNSDNVANMRQALRMLVHFGGQEFFFSEISGGDPTVQGIQWITTHLPFYKQTLAKTASELVQNVLSAEDTQEVVSKEEIDQWRALKTAAGKALREAETPLSQLPRPGLESSLLGSTFQLNRTEKAIDSMMSQRTLVSPRRK